MSPRVLRIYHSAVVPEYRHRERLLRGIHGYDIHLVAPRSWPEGGAEVRAESDPDVPMHILRTRGRLGHPILFWYEQRLMRRLLRELQPDIVDLHEEPYSLAVAAALRAVRAEVPHAKLCVYTAQNIVKHYSPPFRQFEQRAYRVAAAAYPCSSEAAEVLRRKGYGGELHVLPLGVTVPPERPRTPGPLQVGFVGRLEPYKGGHIALEAFARGASAIDAVLTFVGAGSQEAELRQRAEAAGLGRQVKFAGAVSQHEALERIAAFDVLLVPSLTTPSWKEQFGRVAAQAMIAGAVVVASDSGSLREVVGDGGVLVPEDDAAEMGHQLRVVLLDSARRKELGRRARERALRYFTWESVADGMHDMYQQMIRPRRNQ